MVFLVFVQKPKVFVGFIGFLGFFKLAQLALDSQLAGQPGSQPTRMPAGANLKKPKNPIKPKKPLVFAKKPKKQLKTYGFLVCWLEM